ncbi:MAG: glycosyl transferase [Oceanospirillaceae bacterium]|nr:glycosyl transferase [Oceanospirillaceae bacterium]
MRDLLANLNIAVVLVTFNRAEMLRENLKSLSNQGKLTYFIIDNNSSDNTSEIVSEFTQSVSEPVFYFNTQANLGGAGGFAFGCEKVLNYPDTFSHIWFTDDDVVFSDDCLAELCRYDDQNTILQPMRFAPDGSNAEASAITIDLKSVFILNHKRDSVMSSSFVDCSEPFNIQNIPFEGPLIPMSIFDKIGIPDKRFFIFSDDLDFSLRTLRAGFSIKCIPGAHMTRLRPDKISYNPRDWRSYFVYRNFFRIQKIYGANFFVRYRPYLLALLVASFSLVTGNLKGVRIIKDALSDGMSEDFNLNSSYIPGDKI